MVWKYGLETYFKSEPDGCQGKLVKLYRTDKFVTARCMACDYHVRQSELKVDRTSIVQPRIDSRKGGLEDLFVCLKSF